jgi:hypothetical protein
MSSAPYIAAGGAIGATYLLEHWHELFPSTSATAPPRSAAMSSALDRFASVELPCAAPRLPVVTSVTGAPIMRLPSGAGADFLREALIQRGSLVQAFGSLTPAFEWPRLTARCAQEWIERWLDAWQVANASNPNAFRIEQVLTSAPDTSGVFSFLGSSIGQILTPWVDRGPLPGHDTYARIGPWRSAPSPARFSSLGKIWDRLRALHVEATAAAAFGDITGVFGGLFGSDVAAVGDQVWVGARRVTQAIVDFAGQLDVVGFVYPDAKAEAIAELKRDLHPTRVVERAVDIVLTPIEGAIEHVVGPAISATLGALASSLLPWLVVGGAVYLIARRVAP